MESRQQHSRSRSRSRKAETARDERVQPAISRSRSNREPRDASSSSSGSCSSESEIQHFEWERGMCLNSKYHLTDFLGDGTFGRVVLASDTGSGREVAIKIIRNVKKYTEDARYEAAVLEQIRKADPEGTSGCAVMYETFMHEGTFFCLVFEPLGPSLYDVLKGNKYQGFWMQDIQSIAKQCMQALAFLHGQLRMTHTDLKPENILLLSRKAPQLAHFPRESDGRGSGKYVRHVSSQIKIIDFGNTTHELEQHASLINTRQYRGLEVLLYLGWNHSSDLWSIGCILMELYAGDQLFETHEELEHLALIERIIGAFPKEMVRKTSAKTKNMFFVPDDGDGWRLPWPERASSPTSERHVQEQIPLRQQVLQRHSHFADFVDTLLQLDPRKRAPAANALLHPFFAAEYQD
eukprot:TRINITY_DN113574_c0_g1_i1.p1 TRINITY_DN113574_c0_g1~~TRINITY_DN113574_c0_g1_i1.p1  ORF type:complete len:418 (+),score=79.69 TRINITY_DN113574_c0_g1_i1:34-1254(+)